MSAERRFTFTEEEAQAVVLVRALEETDRSGEILPLAERRAATAAARSAHPDGDTWLAVRAGRLVESLQSQLTFLPRLLRSTRPVRGLLIPVLALAILLGLATNALGPEKRIQVLALPLLGLIVWNLCVLALAAVRALLPFRLSSPAPGFVERLEDMARRLSGRWPKRGQSEEQQQRLQQTLERYLADWLPAVAPLSASRGWRLLHASSLVLVVGVVLGMYLRGVAFQYHATWGSTFLNSQAVDVMLGTILAPASTVLGIPVPSASAIESPAYGDAGPWIHLWAMTAALFVGLPRLVLVALASWRCYRGRQRFPVQLPAAYVRRLLASVDTDGRSLEVLPFSYKVTTKAAENLKRLLYELFGPRSEIRLRPTLDYGFEPEQMEPGAGRLRLILFGLAQTPEAEVHGELLRRVCDDLPDGQALLVVVDGSSYRRRLAGGERVDERLAQRRRAWDRVVRDVGGTRGGQESLRAVHLDLLEEAADDVLPRLMEAAWPTGVLEIKP